MTRVLSAALLIAVAIVTSFHSAHAQNPDNIPMPEFYGIYALIDGKLCGITVPTQDCSIRTLDVKIGSNKVKAIEYRKGTRFLVYEENPSAFAAALSLRPMLFVRNVTISARFPNTQNQDRSEAANFWRLVNPAGELNTAVEGALLEQTQPIQLLVKPFKANSVLAVASKELPPGLYHFSGKDLMASNVLYFWVGSTAEAEANRCADLVRATTMGITMEDRYKSCSAEMKAAQAVIGEADPSGNSSVSSTTTELIEISKKLDDASIRGDRATIESYLTDDFVYRDVGNHKSMDRAKFLSKIKPDKSIKSYNCHDYKLTFEGDQAVLSGLCEYDIRQFISLNVKQRFTDRFVKREGGWKLAVSETIVLPNR